MRQNNRFLLSVIVPCFNEEDVIQLTHRRLIDALGAGGQFTLEIVYINDGSTDRTEELLFALADQDERVKIISLTRNFGHQPAVAAGLAYATGDAIVIIDADLQDPPEEIPQMIALWRNGLDVVYGVRTRRKENFFMRFAYASFYRLYRLVASIDVPLDSGDFALLDRRVVDVLNSLPEKNRFVRGLRTWVGFSQGSYVYERAARAAGETKYPIHKLLKLAFDGIFNFSTTPLTVIFLAGATVSIVAATAALVYFVARICDFTIFGHTPEEARGFTTLILTILFFSGVQMVSVGILGEYLGRIYQEAKMRPTYLVKETRGQLAGSVPMNRVL
jgi:glycosyltransferase involved in cell wall biosynthesis